MKSAIASLLLLGAATFNAHAADRPVVQVQTGQLQGVIENDMHAFKGDGGLPSPRCRGLEHVTQVSSEIPAPSRR